MAELPKPTSRSDTADTGEVNRFTISQRMLRVQHPVIPAVAELIRQHPGTISLGQGVVHYAPPVEVGQAVAKAATADPRIHRYGLAFGIDELLEAIATKLRHENGIHIGESRRVVVTAGSNMGFLNAVLAVAGVGDEVIVLAPYYFNHEMAIEMAGCRVVAVQTDEDYQPVFERIVDAVTDRTRAIVTISPNNPSGAVYSRESLAAINRFCHDRGLYHIVDEAYEYFTDDQSTHFSPGSLPGTERHTISLYSLSKAYGMAGWRAGYMVIPEHLELAVKKIQDTNLICPPILNQIAATAALRCAREWCARQIAPLAEVRRHVLDRLAGLGDRVRVPRPDGAFYALLRVNTDRHDMDLVEALIRDFRVAVIPGSTFGTPKGCYLRVAFGALEARTVAEGIGRLVQGLERLV